MSERKTKQYKIDNSKRYAELHYTRIPFDVRKEEYVQLKKCADSSGMPLNTFIKSCVGRIMRDDFNVTIDKWLQPKQTED